MKTGRIIFLAGLSVVLIGGTFIIINKQRKKKVLAKIDEKIESGEGEYGDTRDLQDSNAFNPEYWKTVSSTQLFDITKADSLAKQFKEAIGTFNSDEEKVITLFDQFSNKAQISQVAYRYDKIYGKNFLAALTSVDGIILGFGNIGDTMEKVMKKINKLK